MRRILLIMLAMSCVLFIAPATKAADKEIDYSVELVAKIDFSEYFDQCYGMRLHDNQLWISGIKRGAASRTYLEFGFDISNLKNPDLLWSREIDAIPISPVFYNNYAFKLISQKDKDIQLEIYNLDDARNPKLVNTMEFEFRFGSLQVSKGKLFFFGKDYGNLYGGQVYMFSLADPANPRLITNKVIDERSDREYEFIPFALQQIIVNENYIYGISNSELLLLSYDNDHVKYVTKQPPSFPRIYSLAYAGETLFQNQDFLYAVGQQSEITPIEKDSLTYRNYNNNVSAISIVAHQKSDGYMGENIYMQQIYSLPFQANDVLAEKTLAFVFGHDQYKQTYPYNPDDYNNLPSKLLVIDYKQPQNPEIVYEYPMNSPSRQVIQDDDLAYCFKANNELEIIRLPESKNEFQRMWGDPEDESTYDPLHRKDKPETDIEKFLRIEANKQDDSLTKSDFKDIKTLELYGKNISNLDGIELCTDLEELNLSYNGIEDISPLGDLRNLKSLELSGNDIKNIKPIENLTNLETLNISSNKKISDISPIARLTKLKKLSISGITNPDLEVLKNLKSLEELSLWATRITDISPLSKLVNLKKLTLGVNDIQDLSPLKGMKKLEDLDISGIIARDFSPIGSLTNLKTLDIGDNRIGDASFLRNLNKLEKLEVSMGELGDWSVISSLGNLSELDMQSCAVTDISFISDLSKLEKLYLYRNQISELPDMSALTKLKALQIDGNKIVNISQFSHLEDLETLDLRANEVSDLSPLSKLDNLNRLDISNNQITDISPLKSCKKLRSLKCENNEITDLTPLTKMDSIESVSLDGNKINDISPLLDNKRKNECLIHLRDNALHYSEIIKNRLKLIRNGWILGPDSNEYQSIVNLIGLAEMSEQIGEKDPDKDFGTYEDIENSGWFAVPFDRAFPNYELALFDIKKSDADDKSSLVIAIKPVNPESNYRIFVITEEKIPYEYIGETDLTDFKNLDLDNENRWKKWTRLFSAGGICSGGG